VTGAPPTPPFAVYLPPETPGEFIAMARALRSFFYTQRCAPGEFIASFTPAQRAELEALAPEMGRRFAALREAFREVRP
jgi:hypothetical protein